MSWCPSRVHRRCDWLALLLALAAPASWAQTPAAPQTLSHGLFTDVQVFRPPDKVQQFVLLLSGNDDLNAGERRLAESMANSGAMVTAVNVTSFYRHLEAQSGQCAYAAGAFENLAHYVQAFDKLPTYLPPMLVGTGGGATFAYALLAQAPSGTFASALSLGFCPGLISKVPLCATNALHWKSATGGKDVELLPATQLSGPWTVLQIDVKAACASSEARAFVERVPQATWVPLASSAPPIPATELPAAFATHYARLAARQVVLGLPPAQLADLPIVEVPPAGAAGARFAVLLSGDGGWAGIDKGIAAALVKQDVPVVGFDSLRYFWTARTPEGLALDLDRMIRYYAALWKRSEVIVIGYSQGADVLPFALNRLPVQTRASVRLAALLGPGKKASFEFHVTNWIGASGERPIAPEAQRLSASTTLCVYGTDERDSLCPLLVPEHAQILALPGGHHFGGDYDVLVTHILDSARR